MTDETTPQDDAAMSPASTGSVEPVAWGVVDDRGLQLAIHATPERASSMARNFGVGLAEIVPLYRRQQPALTDAEREAVEAAAGGYEDDSRTFREEGSPDEAAHHAERAATLRGLLERLVL